MSIRASYTATATAFALSLLLLGLACAPALAVQGRPYLETLSLTPGSEPRTLITDAAGNLYVTNNQPGSTSQGIERFDSAGNPLNFSAAGSYIAGNKLTGTTAGAFRQLGLFEFGIASGLGIDASGGPAAGYLYAPIGAGEINGVISGGVYAFDSSTGEYKGTMTAPTMGFSCGLAVKGNGEFYETAGNRFPTLFAPVDSDPEHNTLSSTLKAGSGCAIALDATGAIYYSSYNTGTVLKYPESQVGSKFPTGTEFSNVSARALTVDPGSQNVVVNQGERILEYTSGGAQVGEILGLWDSSGAAFGAGGKLYVTQPNASILVFGPSLVQLPKVTTEPATTETPVDATLHGSLDPDGAGDITSCEFEFGLNQNYTGGTLPCSNPLPISGAEAVSAQVSGLTPETTYHFQLIAENANGVQLGADQTFTAPPAVEGVATGDATDVTKESATLHGSFVGRGEANQYYFEWGPDSNYGNSAPAAPASAGSATGPQEVPPAPLTNLASATEYHYRLVMTNAYGKRVGDDRTFTTPPAVTNVAVEPVTGITNHSAELHGSFDADSYEVHYYFEWGATTNYGKTSPAPPGTAIPPGSGHVSLPAETISGLQEGGVYHYRVVASNAKGVTYSPDASFITAERPSVGNLNTQTVLANSAKLTGEVDPNLNPTSYYFEWGSTDAYGNKSPGPSGDVGAGGSGVPVSTAIEGLSPDLTYHFRLVATNEYGSDVSADQSFSFHPANCPNAQLRQETRSNHLPDCRAYELVTPQFAQGTLISPERGPAATFATSPSRLAYAGNYGTFPEETGDPSNVLSDLYVSTRTATGWYQKFVGKPAYETFMMGGPPASVIENFAQPESGQYRDVGVQATPDLSKVISYDLGWPSNNFGQQAKTYSNAPYIFDTATGKPLERWPTNLADVTNGEKFVGWPQASKDASHFVFQSNLIFAPGGTEVAREVECCSFYTAKWLPASIYDNDVATGEVSLASIKGDDTTTFQGHVFNVSEDGSRILMSEERASPPNRYTVVEFINDVHGPLYLRADGEHTYEIAPGHQIAYVGSSGDGRTVYLRSAEQLTPDDHDSSTDLFVWHESDEELTRVSVGDSGEIGNSDSCGVSWSGGGCNVEAIERNKPLPEGIDRGGLGNTYSDNPIATANGDIYFVSPEQLLEGRGQQGVANLYLYRDGSLRFVAALNEEAGSVFRMQVSPSGEHMAFLTRARVTAYDNAGHMEMYSYSPESGRVICTSCRPDGAPPTSDVQGSRNGLFQAYDGRTFFSTDEALVARDTDKVQDIYEYTEGRAQLISSGIGAVFSGFEFGAPSGFVGVSANGVDAYFATVDSLVTQDHNGASLKIYDARTGGGFPAERTPEKCAAADECHAAGAGPPVLPPDRTGARLATKPKPRAQKPKKKHGQQQQKKKKRGKRKRGRANRG